VAIAPASGPTTAPVEPASSPYAPVKQEANEPRVNEVIKLRNCAAADVATAVQAFMTTVSTKDSSGQGFRQTVIVAEPVTNTVLISASRDCYPKVLKMVEDMDAAPVRSTSSPAQTQQIGAAAPPIGASKLKMLLRLGDGKPRFEIRNTESTELLFKVFGEKVELQSAPEGMQASPIAGVTAVGQVRFVGPGIEGTCDQLSVLSGTGEVLLKGNVHMKTKHGKAWNEVTGEKMIYQIGANGLSTTSNGSVVPASYNSR
jgi:hypothetical protein